MSHLGQRITALVDGELDPGARERALAHVAGCAECRQLLDAERAVKRALSGAADPDLPPHLLSGLLSLGDPGDPLPPRARPMAHGPLPSALPPPGRTVGARARRPGPYSTSPSSRPGRPAQSRRTARRIGALAGGTLSLGGLALGAAFWLGGSGVDPGVPIQPPVVFDPVRPVTPSATPTGTQPRGARPPGWLPGLTRTPVPAASWGTSTRFAPVPYRAPWPGAGMLTYPGIAAR